MPTRDGMTREKQALKMDQASSLHHRSRRRWSISLRRPVTLEGRVAKLHPISQIVLKMCLWVIFLKWQLCSVLLYSTWKETQVCIIFKRCVCYEQLKPSSAISLLLLKEIVSRKKKSKVKKQ